MNIIFKHKYISKAPAFEAASHWSKKTSLLAGLETTKTKESDLPELT